ncbi:polysaccharide deacetylase family protein [Lactococcus laudensis]|uniref:Polysaccharide deacetylase family protein n=1 Tax=Pseudolactococcus laudensis TaxID=1494461 RepID=A0A7V8N160_9LACT|nr:polysaccharide deacetylase family protein [Lactococcus laudensis]MBA0016538.1 polysaccharide deacetylase family protein [Lactococcus laudensis]MBW9281218.1 polysaccharide deacetylase family protein [Lactococcus laudensis]
MKKVLQISIVVILVALVGMIFFKMVSGKSARLENRPIKVTKSVADKVVGESSEKAKSSTSSEQEQAKPEHKWVKSDTPIEFPILMYHHIADVVDGNTLFVPADEFKMEMTALKNAGYYTLSPEEAYRVLTTNEKPAEKIVWVTFDDGYKNAHDTAMPILTALGMKGSFFIITGNLGNEDTMTDVMLSDLKANPLMSVGSHTVSHPDLEYSSNEAANAELVDSKKYLDNLLHQDTSVICYPAGRYNTETAGLAEAAGYKLGLTTNPGLASSANGLFALNRVRVSYGQTEASFMASVGN